MFSARGSTDDADGDDSTKQGSFLESSGLLNLFTTPEKDPEQEHEERVAQLRKKRQSQQPAARAGPEEPPAPIKNMNSFCRPKAEEKPGLFQGLMAMVQPAAPESPAQAKPPAQAQAPAPEPGYGDQVMGYFSGLLSGVSQGAPAAQSGAAPTQGRGSWWGSFSGPAEASPAARKTTAESSGSSPVSRAGRVMSDASVLVSGLQETVTHNVSRVQKHVDRATSGGSEWQKPELGYRPPPPQE